MSAPGEPGPASSPQRFTKRVPATSCAPTYKLTLPSEVVQDVLGHLIDPVRPFQLVDAAREHSWDVHIQPRKNKDKYEYTVHGWRPFAVDQGVRTGDLLEFVLEAEDRLQVNVRKRAEYQPSIEASPRDTGAAQSFNEEQQLREVSLLLGGDAPESRAEGMSESDPQRSMRVAENYKLVNELVEEQPSPRARARQLATRASGVSVELGTPRQQASAQGQLQPFLRSGEMAAYMAQRQPPPAEPLWRRESQRKRRIGDVLPAAAPEAELEYQALDQRQEEELLGPLDFSTPDLGGSPMLATPAARPPSNLLPGTGVASPLGPMRAAERQRGDVLEHEGLGGAATPRPRGSEELQAALDLARMRAEHAEAQANELARALGSMRGEVLHATTRCLGLAHALCSASDALPLLGTPAAAGLDVRQLNDRLQQCARGIAGTLWDLQQLTQDRNHYQL